jgi:hypothetical protein
MVRSRSLFISAFLFSAILYLPRLASAAENDANSRPLTGVVLDAQGKPLSGVDVWLLHAVGTEGEELGRTRTNSAGAFKLTIPGRWVLGGRLRQNLAVIAFQPQLGLTGVSYANITVPPENSCKLVLGKTTEAELVFAKPDNSPMAGAKVAATGFFVPCLRPDIGSSEEIRSLAGDSRTELIETPSGLALGRQPAPLPIELRRKFVGATTANGSIVFPGFPADLLGSFTVDAPGLGRQIGSVAGRAANRNKGDRFPRPIVLRATGSVTGRLQSPDTSLLSKCRIVVESHQLMAAGVRNPAFSLTGLAEATPDAEGRFTIPAIAANSLIVHARLPPGSPYLAPKSGSMPNLEPGKTAKIDIELQRACKVSGLLRARDTGKPLEGVAYRLTAESWDKAPDGYTDSQGRYVGYVLPGKLQRLFSNPPGYLPPDIKWNQDRMIDKATSESVLPALECDRPIDVDVRVVDQAGNPRNGATVRVVGTAYLDERSYHPMKEWTVQTDASGQVKLHSLDCREPLRLEARDGTAFTAAPVTLTDRKSHSLELKVGGGKGLALAGRLLDSAGKPVAGAQIQVWSRCWARENNYGLEIHSPHLQTFDGGSEVRTDAEGRYRTKPELFPGNEYSVQAIASNIRSKQTDWMTSEAVGKSGDGIDLIAYRIQGLSGRVRDSSDKAVAGTRVLYTAPHSQNLEARTGGDGGFQIDGVSDSKGFVVVRQSGFRTRGKRLISAEESVNFVLERSDEKPNRTLRTLPPPLAETERRKLAATLLEPLLKKALASKDENARTRPLEFLARLDPARVLTLLESHPYKDAWYNDYIRNKVVQNLLHDSRDEALAIIESMQRAYWRAGAYLEVANSIPATDVATRRKLLGQALVQAHAESEAQYRIVELAQAAQLSLDLGDVAEATKILRAAEPDARALPITGWAAYARGCFAEALVRIDGPAALALIDDLKDPYEFDRHYNNIALILAAVSPEKAESALGNVRQVFQREHRMPYVANRMARVDYPRARKLVEGMTEGTSKARALGLMAKGLAEKDRPEAIKVFREAFALLNRLAADGEARFNNMFDGATLAGSLLPEIERLSPELVPEFLWEAVALRHPEKDGATYSQQQEADLSLAAVLARYDRDLARTLIEAWSHDAGMKANNRGTISLITAMALVDPAWAATTIDQIPDQRVKDSLTERIIGLLTTADAEFYKSGLRGMGLEFEDKPQ